jgi:hypothetical protein
MLSFVDLCKGLNRFSCFFITENPHVILKFPFGFILCNIYYDCHILSFINQFIYTGCTAKII